MKKTLLLSICLSILTITVHAQVNIYDKSSYSKSSLPSFEEMYLQAQLQANARQIAGQRFEECQTEALKCFYRKEYRCFLNWSAEALNTGFYTVELYEKRGIAYEELGDIKSARAEYKRAKRHGSYGAQQALIRLKRK